MGLTRYGERFHRRDLRLNDRHRMWQPNCPAVDIDFLLVEYDHGKSSALVEHKHETAIPHSPAEPNYKALVDLGDRASLPMFEARYADDFSWYEVRPLNDVATYWISGRQRMTEREYVHLLYEIRGYPEPKHLDHLWEQK